MGLQYEKDLRVPFKVALLSFANQPADSAVTSCPCTALVATRTQLSNHSKHHRNAQAQSEQPARRSSESQIASLLFARLIYGEYALAHAQRTRGNFLAACRSRLEEPFKRGNQNLKGAIDNLSEVWPPWWLPKWRCIAFPKWRWSVFAAFVQHGVWPKAIVSGSLGFRFKLRAYVICRSSLWNVE